MLVPTDPKLFTASDLFNGEVARLAGIVEHFVRHGVFVVSHNFDTRTPELTNESALKKFSKEVARELGRPFIFCVKPHRLVAVHNGVPVQLSTLLIPDGARFTTLHSALALVSEPLRYSHSTPSYSLDAPGVGRHNRGPYCFVGDNGHAILDAWLEQCRTDPVFRVVLKTPRLT